MVFWGIEVKPGKPYTHEPNGSRLHISQATLGIGVATNKSTVQCNVGDASPVFICSLFPGKEESAQINLEFEEAHQVIFSVLGVRSVHLTGYNLGKGREIDDDLESYGEDIADTETDISEDDDQYEDSFINDGDVEFLPPSPMPNKSEKEKPNHKKARKGKDHRRRLRKKHEKWKSDKVNSLPQQNSEALLLESDEEDFFVSSLLKKKSSAKDSEINVPVVVMETTLDVVKKKQKQDGSTAVKSSESLSPTVVGGEPGSTAKKMKSKLHSVEGQTQNQAWQEDKEPKVDDPSKKSSAVEVEQVPSGENCKKSKKKKKKDDSSPHQNPAARSSIPNGEDFFVSSPLKKKSSAKDSETEIPDVVMVTPLDVAKKKQKQDGSTAVKSSKKLSPSAVEGEPGSTLKKMKSKLHIMAGETQNQTWQEDKKPKADDPSKKSSAVEVEQVPNGENCKKSKKKKQKDNSLRHQNSEAQSSIPDGGDFFVSSPLEKKSSAKDLETKIPDVVIETPLDVAEKKKKQDGSTAVNSSEKKKEKDDSLPHHNPEARSSEPDGEDFFVSSPLKKKSSVKDSETKIPDVVIETPLDVAEKKQKQDGSTAVNSSEKKKEKDEDDSLPRHNPEAQSSEPDGEDFFVSSPLKKKSSVKDLETKIPDVVIETPLDVAEKKQKQDGSIAVNSSESLSPSVVDGAPGRTAKKMKSKLHIVEGETQNQAWQEDKEPKADDSSKKSSSVEVEQVPSGENCKKSEKKKKKVDSLPHHNPEAQSSELDGEDFFVSSPLKKKSFVKDSETKIPDVVTETPLDVAKKKQKRDGSIAVKSSERLSASVVDGEPGSTAKKMRRKLHIMEGETQNQAWQEDKKPKADDPSKKSSAVKVEQVPSRENCKKSKKNKEKDDSLPHHNPEAWSSEPNGEDFFVSSPLMKKSSVKDSETKIPDVVIETPLDVAKKKQKQDGSTAVNSSEKKKEKDDSLPHHNPEARSSEPDDEDFFVSSPLKKKSSVKDSETKIPDVVIETPLDVAEKKQKQDGSIAMNSSESLSPSVVDGEPGSSVKKIKRKLQFMEAEMQNQAWQEDKEPKTDDPTQKSSAVEEQLLSGENCKKSKKKKRKRKLPNGEERRMRNLSLHP